jgi:hypothetical protein
LVERRPYKANVGGSTPSSPTIQPSKKDVMDFFKNTMAPSFGVVVQLVRIPACHAGGRGFESRPLRQELPLKVIHKKASRKRGFFVFNYFLFLEKF